MIWIEQSPCRVIASALVSARAYPGSPGLCLGHLYHLPSWACCSIYASL